MGYGRRGAVAALRVGIADAACKADHLGRGSPQGRFDLARYGVVITDDDDSAAARKLCQGGVVERGPRRRKVHERAVCSTVGGDGKRVGKVV